MSESVGIIGAGPVGCLTGLFLAQKGYDVTLFDFRDDPRAPTHKTQLRSINLAISNRGLSAIDAVDHELYQYVLENVIPMKGRMIHYLSGEQEPQMYGLYGETIKSVDRNGINIFLLDGLKEFELKGNLKVQFKHKLRKIQFDYNDSKQRCEFIYPYEPGKSTTVNYDFDFVIGSDGIHSATREQMQRAVRMDFSQSQVDRCYIELSIPPSDEYQKQYKGYFVISPDYLHIWPRDEFMLIALPNKDGSFTSTFFSSWEILDRLVASKEETRRFFLEYFPDAMEIMGIDEAVEAFHNNPKGRLACIDCKPYHYDGKAILLGDASHSMVPFYGQGLNCGLEDVKVLMELMNKYDEDRSKAFSEYSRIRYKDHLAIIALSNRNYYEMSHDVTSTMYLLRKALDGGLSRILKDKWLPLYTMVTFREDIPYHIAQSVSKWHRKVVNFAISGIFAATAYAGYKFLQQYLKNK
ncbi:hypothetical protein Kpol_1045p12 [Vanderwaltozyma polyspora DSM 70294]|uniref:Kynurenine 3-monooxygenase n=1 Tax=Vanderwaltozyma polyspora (strain ATCC 22028 / DSM 70294 / BCRC 21397 / CBS 2163 / NBRC 10782 / NRRL Y-8283 / UCD 57-17) TaxID=436907 RepID=A7TI21_VANPO|nr:uncharacterized protein Kpol_1045p12 [Vanderwaltozyma polyspora DSM 70294]EDO18028.1 hypothetical protein Kpol_1045p12 [Vanderwaltozyma polyspora DSM 70294]